MDQVFIIAEAGVNHNGDIRIAEKMIDAAVAAGVDAVKFQTFTTAALACSTAPKAAYQKKQSSDTQTQFEMLKALELDRKAHEHLISYCLNSRIKFLSSPFDVDSIFLLHDIGLNLYKIPSGEITNLPYLEAIGSLGKQVIMSTGMADLNEIQAAVDVLVKKGISSDQIALLHCCSEYPTPPDHVNLRVIKAMEKRFPGFKIGYSDHTTGIQIAVAAVAAGAQIIEKHFTLDKNMEGPDHRASIEPDQLCKMVESIRLVEQALGNGIKTATKAERENRQVVRKSIVASIPIQSGEIFSIDNITVKRPGNGLSPMKWYNVLGRKATKAYAPDEPIIG
ncbi:MAG: N-acetylneuraminate synthase [Pseudomonadota bacterium]